MKERPILFSAPMVRALLAGTKTQTRRIVKGAPENWSPIGPEVFSPTFIDRHGDEQPGPDAYGAGNDDGDCWIVCPYGQPGDRLWVRETWRMIGDRPTCEGTGPSDVHYAADSSDDNRDHFKWRPSIFMPRWASRITLELTGVRVERLQDISSEDAEAEGVKCDMSPRGFVDHYRVLWERINGPGSWAANPWVWVLEFKRVKP